MAKSFSKNQLLLPSPLLKLTGIERTASGWVVLADGPDRCSLPRLWRCLALSAQPICPNSQGPTGAWCASVAESACGPVEVWKPGVRNQLLHWPAA